MPSDSEKQNKLYAWATVRPIGNLVYQDRQPPRIANVLTTEDTPLPDEPTIVEPPDPK